MNEERLECGVLNLTPSSHVREREREGRREKEREGGRRERKREEERERKREAEREKEGGRERDNCYFKRNGGCLGTF
jgi:hypothetical protein